jgi:hypothetical protein
VAVAEEGWPSAAQKVGWSAFCVVLTTPIFKSELASHIMFSFPELVFVIMGALVWIGGYTGYRVIEWFRFRPLVAAHGAP